MDDIDIPPEARPRFRPHVRVQWDPVRERHVVLMPEGVLVLNETATAVAALCDGERSVSAITAELGSRYRRVVMDDILTLVRRFASKGVMDFVEDEP